jgi:hypothetical protein
MVVSDIALGGLTKAMEGLTNQLKSTMDFAMKADKASAALGTTFEKTNDQLGGTMEGLRGDLNQRFAGAIAGMEAGLQGNTAGVAHLVNQQRLTGTQSAKTAKTFAKMEATLGNSRESTNKLAGLLPELGATWQVSTDLLVGAIDTLAKSFPAQKLAGMGAEVTQAFTTLTAELGPSMKGPMDSVMSMIMDTSMKGYENLTKLGIGNVREQLASAKTAAEAQSIIKDAIQKASGTFKDVVGDASQGFFQVGVASEIFGESAIQLTAVNDAFGTRVKQEGADAEAFGNQLGVIKDEIMLPLQEMLKEFFPIIKGVGIVIGTKLRQGITVVVDALTKVFLKLGGFSGMIESIKKKFGDLGKKFKLAKDIAIPLLIGALATLTAMAVGLGVALLPVIWPFLLFGGIVVAVVAAFRALEEKFGFMDKVTGLVVEAFQSLKHGLGSLLISLSDMIPFSDKLAGWGLALQESSASVLKNREIEASAKAKGENIDNMNHSEVMGALNTQLKVDKDTMGLTSDIKDSTEETARNTTIDIKTNPEFLDQTANMLGRSIESILGITKDNSAAEIVEELRALNQQTAVLVEKPDPEGAPATAS